jgi:hypothetical protein
MEEIISLNDKLKQFIININLEFSFKSKLSVNFMNYFPLLKDGKAIRSTIIYVIYSYLRILVELDMRDNLFLDYLDVDIKDYLPNKKLASGDISHLLDYDVIKKLYILVSQNSEHSTLDEIECLEKEKNLSICLEKVISFWSERYKHQHSLSYNDGNLLNILHVLCEIETSLFFELLKDDNIKLLCSIINNDKTDIIMCLYVDDTCLYLEDVYDFAYQCYSYEYVNSLSIFLGLLPTLVGDNSTCTSKILQPNELQNEILNLIKININK